MGLPLQFTRISGLLTAARALIKSVCTGGSSIFVRSPPRKPSKPAPRRGISSPSNRAVIPLAKTTTLAALAWATASSIVCWVGLFDPSLETAHGQPAAKVTSTFGPAACLMPLRIVTGRAALPL